MVCILFSITINAYDFKVGIFYYKIISTENNTVRIVKVDNKPGGTLYVPATIKYMNRELTVLSIKAYAFAKTSFASIFIPKGIKRIEQNTFDEARVGKLTIEDSNEALEINPHYVFSSGEGEIGELYLGRNIIGELNLYVKKKITTGIFVTEVNGLRIGTTSTLVIKNGATIFENRTLNYQNIVNVYLPDDWQKNRIKGDALNSSPLTNQYLGKNGVAIECGTTKRYYLNNPIPPNDADFPDSNYGTATLYVPIGAKQTYMEHPKWKRFWNIVEYDFDGVRKSTRRTPQKSTGRTTGKSRR